MDAPFPTVTPTATQSSESSSVPSGVSRPRVQVIGEHRRGADEDAVRQAGRFIDEGIILEFAVVAQNDAGAHIRAAANIAVAAHGGILTNLRQMPDSRYRPQ